MKKVQNLLRAFCLEYITGYNELSASQKDSFDLTYKKHLSSIHEKERIPYTEKYIKRIDGNIGAIKVHFENGDRYVYLPECKWIKVT